MSRRRRAIIAVQLLIVAGVLITWEVLPTVSAVASRLRFLDPFIISSPSRIFVTLVSLATGSRLLAGPYGPQSDVVLVWPFVWRTVSSTFIGVAIGMTFGGLFGLVLSNSKNLSDVFRPLVVALNAIPPVALIPVIVILLGPTPLASITIASIIVFFVGFYNAYEGGRTIPSEILLNVAVLGADKLQTARFVRLPYSFAWMMATLPLASTFALITVVTSEILTNTNGLGKLINFAYISGDSSLTFAVVFVLSVLGIAISVGTGLVRRRVLHWWEGAIA